MSMACNCDISLSNAFQNNVSHCIYFLVLNFSCSGGDSCEDDNDSSDGNEPQGSQNTEFSIT